MRKEPPKSRAEIKKAKLAKALRQNLNRRKAQARTRTRTRDPAPE
jgi:hypothetical protein